MTEAEFQKEVETRAAYYKILFHHCNDMRRCKGRGMPDLLLIGTHHLIWRELKLLGEKPDGTQVDWKYRLLATGQNYSIWFPTDLESGLIDEQLQSLNMI